MEAHIPCNSYFPVYFSTMNHNLWANGSERNHNLSSDQLFGYYKEAIKQTMLNQEMIFKDQVYYFDCFTVYVENNILHECMFCFIEHNNWN